MLPLLPLAVLRLPVLLRDAAGHPRHGGRVHQLRGHRHELPRLPPHEKASHKGRDFVLFVFLPLRP